MQIGIIRSLLYAADLGAILFLASATVAMPAPQAEPDQRKSAVKGTITNAISGERLRKAFVRLEADTETSYPAITNDRGEFVVEGVQPGTYTLAAEHQGFIETKYGEGLGSSAVQLRLAPGETLININVALSPQAVLSGHIVNEDGDLWTHAQVDLFRLEWQRGRRKVRGFSGGEVNDQGEFRIGQIPPGKYYLSAAPDASWETRNRSRVKEGASRRQPTWYPNSLDLDGATPIVVGPGNQISGLEIRLQVASVHLVRGTLSGGDKVPAFPDRGPFRERSIRAELALGDFVNGYGGVIHADGSFEIQGVPSGAYNVRVSQGLPPIELGNTAIQVADQDIDDVSIPLNPPRSLKGVIRIAGQESMKPARLRITLDSFSRSWNQFATSAEDGTFDFAMVGSERYRVIVRDPSGAEVYVKEIRYGDARSNDGTFSPAGSEGNLEVIVSTHGARLSGVILSADNEKKTFAATATGISKPQVVLIPNSEAGETRLANFDQNGAFLFDNVPPGTFTMYAFESVPEGAWDDPDFLKALSGTGIEVRLAESEQKSVDVPLRSKSDLAPILRKLGFE